MPLDSPHENHAWTDDMQRRECEPESGDISREDKRHLWYHFLYYLQVASRKEHLQNITQALGWGRCIRGPAARMDRIKEKEEKRMSCGKCVKKTKKKAKKAKKKKK